MTEQPVGVVPEFTIGDRLRKAREVTGLDQEQFALAIGVSRGTVSNYEGGTTTHLKPIVLKQWALHAGVLLEWIETGIVPDPTGPDGEPGADDGTRTRNILLAMRKDASDVRYLSGVADAA